MTVAAAQIVEAGPFDVAVLAALHESCFGGAPDPAEIWSARALAELLAMPGSFAFLARDTDRPFGYLFARDLPSAAPDDCEILSLGVVPAARRRGVASQLLASARRRAAGGGAKRLILEVAEDNLPAQTLYRSFGFSPVGRRDGYYKRGPGRSVAALQMSCDLADSL